MQEEADRPPATPQEFAKMLRAVRRQSATVSESLPVRPLLWLALAPAWPLRIAMHAFPGKGSGMLHGADVENFLKEIEQAGQAESVPAELQWDETWYSMGRKRRAGILEESVRTHGLSFVQSTLLEAASSMRRASTTLDIELTSAIERWADLGSTASSVPAMADIVDKRVEAALEGARSLRQLACPEALRWIETAEPLAKIFGGSLLVEVERAKRRLELFHRQARDERYLDNYFPRKTQDQVLEDLLRDDRAWALHFVGVGGMGKTMLLRHIRIHLAPKLDVVTARIDFDELSPDYPERAPGLLLMGLAEELRLRVRDPKIISIFKEFDDVIKSVHDKLEGIYRSGEQQSTAGIEEGTTRAIKIFAAALRTIYDVDRKTPLLILDTCEELAKLRADGSLPNSVVNTFEVLEQVHQQFDKVRVIFAGRRPLASSGFGWSWKDCPLLPRPYLRLHEVRGFINEDAKKFLAEYHKEDRRVPSELWEPIIDKSLPIQDELSTSIEWKEAKSDADAGLPRYNPYDLDLYASWACTGEGLSRDRLASGGTHYYVKERILGRVHYRLLSSMADIVLLGRFDREMLEDLTGLEGTAFSNFVDYLVGLEWVDTDHTARRKGDVWAIDRRLQQRLVSYYKDEDPLVWKSARSRVLPILRRITIHRSWDELAVTYFETAFEVLKDDPVEAAAWWQELETKIARDAAWNWARDITERLLVDGGPASLANPVLKISPEDECVLRPAVRATQASACLHAKPPKDTKPIWEEVLRKCDRHPTRAGAELLRYRAAVGLVPLLPALYFGALFGYTPPGKATGVSRLAIPFPKTEDPQCLASEIAMLERGVEELERTSVFTKPVLTDRISGKELQEFLASRFAEFSISAAPADLAAFYLLLMGRWHKLEGRIEDAERSFAQALEYPIQPESQHWCDWKRPDDLRSRVLLEWLRANSDALQRVQKYLTDFSPTLINIDVDRLVSAMILISRRHRLPDIQGQFLLAAAETQFEPECNAHRSFPARLVGYFQALADHGRFDEIYKVYERLSNTKLPFEVRQGIDRVMLETVVRMRLGEERIGVTENSVTQSSLTRDNLLNSTVAIFTYEMRGDHPADVPGRWLRLNQFNSRASSAQRGESESLSPDVPFEEFSVDLDRQEAYVVAGSRSSTPARPLWQLAAAWRDSHPNQLEDSFTLLIRCLAIERQLPGADVEARFNELGILPIVERIGTRRAAEIALEEGSVLALRLPVHAIPELELARYWFGQVGDHLGTFLCAATLAQLYARQSDKASFEKQMSVFENCYEGYRQQDRSIRSWHLLKSSVQEPDKAEKTMAEFIKETPREWRPWISRTFACMVRVTEFNQAGPQTQTLRELLDEHYRQNWPPELRGMLAADQARPAAASAAPQSATIGTSIKAEAPAKAPGRRWILITVSAILGLGMIFLIISNAYSVLNATARGNFRTLSIFQIAVFALTVFAFAPQVVRRLGLFKAQAKVVPQSGTTVKEGIVAPVSVQVKLVPRLTFSPGAINRVTELQPQAGADASADPKKMFQSGEPNAAVRRGLYFVPKLNVELVIPAGLHGIPWENVLSLYGASANCRFRRHIDRPGVAVGLKGALNVCTWASDLSDFDVARLGWKPLTDRPGVTFAVSDAREQNVQTKSSDAEIGILHVIGSVSESTSGLRIRTSRTDLNYELSPSRILANSTDLRLCILQGFPTEITMWTDTDRTAANLMRRLAAELAQTGIPAVLTVPPLPPETAQIVIQSLARAVDRKSANAIPSILEAIAEIRESIAKSVGATAGADAAGEVAFDVCVYSIKELNLRWKPITKGDPPR